MLMNISDTSLQISKEQLGKGSILKTLQTYKTVLCEKEASLIEKSEAYEAMGELCVQIGEMSKARFFYTMAIYANPLSETAYRRRIALFNVKALPKITVSVIISSYYRYEQLVQTIHCVRQNTFFPVQIIVVADKCDDGTVEYILSENGKNNFVGIVNNTHKGNVASLITGLCQSRGDYIVLIADDIQVMPGWDLEIVHGIGSDPKTGCGVPLIVDSEGNVDSAGQHNEFLSNKYDWIGRIRTLNADLVRGKNILNHPEFHQPRECDYGFIPVLKRKCLEQIGSVDGAYRHYFFDPDLGYTLQKNGWKNTYCPTSTMVHHQKKLNETGEKEINSKAAPEYYYFVNKWGLRLP